MKKKILFYGNCQLAVISRILQLQTAFNESYEVLKAQDYEIADIWLPEVGTVAAWRYRLGTTYGLPTRENIKSVNKIIEDSDVIILQDLKEQAKRPIEFTTKFIYDTWSNKKQIICIPSFWFSGYLSDPFHGPVFLPYLFLWLLQNKLSKNSDIIDFLKNSSHPNISKLIKYNFECSFKELEKRQKEESSIYNTFVSVLDFVSQYKTKFLCYNHSHPSELYYEFLYEKIIKILNPNLYDSKIKLNVFCPGPDLYPLISEFFFFKENFPNIIGCDESKYKIKLDEAFVDRNITNIIRVQKDRPEEINEYIKKRIEILNS